MTNETEPRALGAALAAPAFVTRNHGVAMHAANRHVERWAPEASAGRVRSMRSLGFVDRLVAPWLETAQRSASLRLFSGYLQGGMGEREPGAVSWVFPRPWYQDELDWMTAARQVSAQPPENPAPSLFTTRGTYVAPTGAAPGAIAAPAVAMPAALYEYVAPSLSLAGTGSAARPAGSGATSGGMAREAYSPLVPLAAVQAAELMSRAVSPLAFQRGAGPATAMTPALRSVLSSILERAAAPAGAPQLTRLAQVAPELVTPPAPRPPLGQEGELVAPAAAGSSAPASELTWRGGESAAARVADQYAEQRARIAELQQIAQREAAAPRADRAAASSPSPSPVRAPSAPDTGDTGDAAERARLIERTAQRLHDQARREAAAHARRAASEPAPVALDPAVPTAAERAPAPADRSAELAAAIAGLPPGLSGVVSQAIDRRPERAMQSIREIHEALRTAELLARSSATGAVFEATRGPRLVMPAGLGGLISAVDRAQAITDRTAALSGPRGFAAAMTAVAPGQPAGAGQAAEPAPARSREARVPTLAWLSAAPRAQAMAPVTALGATASLSPAALSHVAWSDRWLARFAGAAPQSLDMISAAAAASPALRMRALAEAAPGAVFVVPDALRGDLEGDRAAGLRPVAGSIAGAVAAPAPTSAAATSGAVAAPRSISPPVAEPLVRFDDDAETPDDVFAAISAAAARGRTAASRRPEPPVARAAAPATGAPAGLGDRAAPISLADTVAHAAPAAPGAGMSARLASSPFAPALHHVLSLPHAASFDIRSLFGAGLGATYLAGLLGSAVRELEIGAQRGPAWSESPLSQPPGADPGRRLDRLASEFDAAYVAPDALEIGDAGELAGSSESLTAGSTAAGGAGLPGQMPVAAPGASEAAARSAASTGDAALVTLRSPLLSWQLAANQLGAPELAPSAFATLSGGSGGAAQPGRSDLAAQMMIEAMSLPMLGEAAEPSPAWAAPGMVADRAHRWSVAQERSASDLALDFVMPELVLAARVYGFGPAEAAQAARLAIVGPGQLGAMASAVDRTFVEAIALGREARTAGGAGADRPGLASGDGEGGPATREAGAGYRAQPGRAAITTAFPTADGSVAAALGRADAPVAAAPGSAPSDRAASAGPGASTALFGVARRMPRGAFLWPSAAVAALGMTATGSDGQLSMSVAALELLAAQVVAELGTFTALSELDAAARERAGELDASAGGAAADAGQPSARTAPDAAPPGGYPGLRSADPAGRRAEPAELAEPGEADVLGAAAAMVPSSRRARFDALYVALSQSTAGRSWSPAARAARALALAGRGDDTGTTARERATAAWDVLPVVYLGGGRDLGGDGLGGAAGYAATSAPGGLGGASGGPGGPRGVAGRAGGARDVVAGGAGGFGGAGEVADASWPQVTAAPGLAGLSARAGDALGAYVEPVAAPSAPVQRPVETTSVGAMLRPPSSAPEYVQTGRSGGRYGGGEVEIPPWFEAAARKMFAERSGSAEGISLAELTLVNAAPASQIAAATRGPTPSSTPPGPSSSKSAGPSEHQQVDVDKVAEDVYRKILVMMDIARARNGEPYL